VSCLNETIFYLIHEQGVDERRLYRLSPCEDEPSPGPPCLGCRDTSCSRRLPNQGSRVEEDQTKRIYQNINIKQRTGHYIKNSNKTTRLAVRIQLLNQPKSIFIGPNVF